MHLIMFYHSLLSDWNNGHAHFLRGIVSEFLARGHQVEVYEPAAGWSLSNLVAEQGGAPIRNFKRAYPGLASNLYDPASLDLSRVLERADLVLVHEWNDPDLVRRLGRQRARSTTFKLLFHDTHHRAVTDPQGMAAFDLAHYDGVLVFGRVIRDLYLDRGWAQRAWTWHEAADIRVFKPQPSAVRSKDLVWIGNWGDDERTQEIQEYLLKPARDLGLAASAYGVRYPEAGRRALAAAGFTYHGWLPNYRVPQVFAGFKVTTHIPRRPYVQALPGIPTIRVFEALACGIPLICSHWEDAERLFTPGADYLVARTPREMKMYLREVAGNDKVAQGLADSGLRTIRERHTCAHRVNELLGICRELDMRVSKEDGQQPPKRGTS